jgi:hypothetical protein
LEKVALTAIEVSLMQDFLHELLLYLSQNDTRIFAVSWELSDSIPEPLTVE